MDKENPNFLTASLTNDIGVSTLHLSVQGKIQKTKCKIQTIQDSNIIRAPKIVPSEQPVFVDVDLDKKSHDYRVYDEVGNEVPFTVSNGVLEFLRRVRAVQHPTIN